MKPLFQRPMSFRGRTSPSLSKRGLGGSSHSLSLPDLIGQSRGQVSNPPLREDAEFLFHLAPVFPYFNIGSEGDVQL